MANDNIRLLKPKQKELNKEVVELLERVLEDAKAGNIEAATVVTTKDDGSFNYGFSPTAHAGAMLGGMYYVLHRLCGGVDNTPQGN